MSQYLIIVNPNSGNGSANDILERHLLPKLGHIYYTICHTKNIDECNNALENVTQFNGVLIVGGDGTISNVVQYMYQNNLNIPIGHIPCGSGNGLMSSILYAQNSYYSLYNALQSVLLFQPKNIDTMEVELLDEGKKMISFLFVSLGVFSNLDLKTEWMRIIGEFRFTLGAIWELLWKDTFRAKLRYKVLNNDENIVYKTVEGEFLYFVASNVTHASPGAYIAPNADLQDGKIKLAYMLQPCSRYQLFQILYGLEDGSFQQHLNYIETTEFEIEPLSGNLDIDGETIKRQPIRVRSNPSSLSLFY
jgi:sphingosine kinase